MKQRVNLYVEALKPVIVRVSLPRVVAATLTVAVLGSSLLAVMQFKNNALAQQIQLQQQAMARQTTDLTTLQQALNQRKPDQQLQDRLQVLQQSNERKQRLLSYLQQDLQQHTMGYADVMAALAALDPTGLWLTDFSFGRDEYRFQGMTSNASLVPMWLKSLGQVPHLQGQQFSDVQISTSTQPGYLYFVVTNKASAEVAP